MKRSIAVILCLATMAVGLWVVSGSQTLNSTCTLSAQTGGGTACVSGLPFFFVGILTIAAGAVCMFVTLLALTRSRRLRARHVQSTISTLHPNEIDSLRDVA